MQGGGVFVIIADIAIDARVLQQYAETSMFERFRTMTSADFYAQRLRACGNDFSCLRQDIGSDIKYF